MTKQTNSPEYGTGFHKETISIDVPDGYEIGEVIRECDLDGYIHLRCSLKEKEPEFIEVRDFLKKDSEGEIWLETLDRRDAVDGTDVENLLGFVRWIDHEWRKVEI